MGIVRIEYTKFFLFSSGWYSSGTGPLYPMQNIQTSNLMRILLLVMIVVNIHANGPRKVVIKCHNFNSKTNGKNPMWL